MRAGLDAVFGRKAHGREVLVYSRRTRQENGMVHHSVQIPCFASVRAGLDIFGGG